MWALSRNVCTKFSENSTLILYVCKKYGRRLKIPINSTIYKIREDRRGGGIAIGVKSPYIVRDMT
jgi:hypothetical protein